MTHRYGQPATFTASNKGAYAIVDFDPDADYVLTLPRYDRYTQARILFPDAEGKVIGWTVTTYGGDTVHVMALNRNGTVNGATQMLIYVTCPGR